MILIDYTDATPIYEQVVSKYKNLIVKGAIKANEKMPSVRSLAMELSINPNTIQKAYTELERQGFIYTVKGRGNFVAEDEALVEKKKTEILAQFQNLIKEASDAGIAIEVFDDYLKARREN